MESAPLSDFDRLRIASLQHERLRQFFAELNNDRVIILTTEENRLVIHCTQSEQVSGLLNNLDDLRYEAFLICGVEGVTIIFNGKVMAECLTLDQLEFDATSLFFEAEEEMATAILDKLTTVKKEALRTTGSSNNTAQAHNRIPGCSLTDIAADVEQEVETVRNWFTASNLPVIPYKGEEIVAGEDAILAYDYFEPLLLQQRKAKRFGTSLPNTSQNSGTAEVEPQPTIQKPVTKKPATRTTAKRTGRRTAARKPKI
jgi:hypothetical protein